MGELLIDVMTLTVCNKSDLVGVVRFAEHAEITAKIDFSKHHYGTIKPSGLPPEKVHVLLFKHTAVQLLTRISMLAFKAMQALQKIKVITFLSQIDDQATSRLSFYALGALHFSSGFAGHRIMNIISKIIT